MNTDAEETRKSLSILIVEDDASWQSIFEDYLTEGQHIIRFADSIGEARLAIGEARLAVSPYDLAIIDTGLNHSGKSNTDGIAVLREISEQGAATKTVITTGHEKLIATYKGIFAQYGVFAYLTKNHDWFRQQLLSIVDRVIALKNKGLWEIEGQPISFETHVSLRRMLEQYLGCIEGNLGQLLLDRGDETLVVRVSTFSQEEGVFRLAISDSISGLAFKQGEPVYADDVTTPKWAPLYKTRAVGMRSELAVPIRYGEKIVGILNFESFQTGAFTAKDEQVIKTFAEQISMTIRNDRLLKGIRALEEISGEILRQPIDEERIWARILDRGLNLVGGRYGNVLLVKGENLAVVMTRAGEEKAKRPAIPQTISIFNSVTGWAVKTKDPQLVNDLLSDEPYKSLNQQLLGPSMRSELAVPIIVQDHVVGVLNVESDRVSAFGEDEKALLMALAEQAASTFFQLQQYGRLSDELGHQVNGQLGALKGQVNWVVTKLQQLRLWEKFPLEVKQVFDKVNEISDGVIKSASSFIHHPHEPLYSRVVNVNAAIHRAIENVEKSDIEIHLQLADDPLEAQAGNLLARAVEILLDNAVYEMKESGGKDLWLRSYERSNKVYVEVEDTGRGIDPILFQKDDDGDEMLWIGFTTKGPGHKGQHGYGLRWAKQYILVCGGDISATNTKLGALFKILLESVH